MSLSENKVRWTWKVFKMRRKQIGNWKLTKVKKQRVKIEGGKEDAKGVPIRGKS